MSTQDDIRAVTVHLEQVPDKLSLADKFLQAIPAKTSSKLHIYLLLGLGLILLVAPFILGDATATKIELIGGNYTNIISAVGASIAAGAGIAGVKKLHTMHADQAAHHKAVIRHLSPAKPVEPVVESPKYVVDPKGAK